MKIGYSLLRQLGHQRWIRFSIRDRIIRLFHKSDVAASEPFTVPFNGFVYEGNLNSFIDWSAYFYGAYSYQELDFLRDVLSQQANPIFVDVGANVGNHSLFAAMHSQRVVAFEPVPHLHRQLVGKQQTNHLTNLSAFNVALGETDMTSSFSPATAGNQGTGRVLTNPAVAGATTISVAVKNGDAFLAEQGITGVTLIKIDVEGYESFVLRGLTNTLGHDRPVVFFEWSQASANHLNGQSVADLFPADYVLYRFEDHRPAYVFFEHSTYQLRPADPRMSAGNYVALPAQALTNERARLLHVAPNP